MEESDEKKFKIPVGDITNEEAEKLIVEMIAEFNKEVDFDGEILFPVEDEDLPPLKEVIEFKDDESDLLKDVSADEVKKIDE